METTRTVVRAYGGSFASARFFADEDGARLRGAVGCLVLTACLRMCRRPPVPVQEFVGNKTEGALLVMLRKLGHDYRALRAEAAKRQRALSAVAEGA